MLEIRNIRKSFDGLKAVDGFSLSLKPQQITSLIGPNGAGKTTVFNIVTGFLGSDSGSVTFHGQNILGNPPHVIARHGIARTFQNLRLFRKMSVMENLMLAQQNQRGEHFINALLTFSKKSHAHEERIRKSSALLEFVDLLNLKNELAENLSYGQQKLVSIACCLAMEPEVLLLDEPVAGVQPAMVEKIISILKHLIRDEGKTIFLIEHDINTVMEISDTIVVMDDGKKIAEDVPSRIRNEAEILEAYLS